MRLTIAVVNHERTSLELPGGAELSLFPRMLGTACAAARRAAMPVSLVVAESATTRPVFADWGPAVWPFPCRVVPLPLPFSLGGGRNVCCNAISDGWIAVIDADMLLPVSLFVGLEKQSTRDVLFPLYDRFTGMDERTTSPGAGWGNVIVHKSVLSEIAGRFGTCWPVTTEYGGEDTGFANRVRVVGGNIVRYKPVGLLHQWHPKTTDWHTHGQRQA